MESQTTTQQEPAKIGRFKKSWIMTKAAWTGLKLDKELMALPVFGMFIYLLFGVAALVFLAFVIPTGLLFYSGATGNELEFTLTGWGYATLIAIFIPLSIVSTFIGGAVMHGALARFKGEDPTIRSSLSAAWQRLGSLASFAVFSYTVGMIISEIAARLPFIGGMVVQFLAGAAWNVASFFALPVIMSSKEPVGPIKATKGSVTLIKKVWGESLIADIGIGVIAFLSVLVYTAVSMTLIGLLSMATAPSAVLIALSVLAFFGILAITLVFSVLSAYVKAAIYHFATTNESPVTFNRQLLRQAFSPKKARKVFSS